MIHELRLRGNGAGRRYHGKKDDVSFTALKRRRLADKNIVEIVGFQTDDIKEAASDETRLFIADERNHSNAFGTTSAPSL